jgi:hypothetical protein
MAVFWVVPPYIREEVYQRFRGTCLPPSSGQALTTQKKVIFILAAVRTSNPTLKFIILLLHSSQNVARSPYLYVHCKEVHVDRLWMLLLRFERYFFIKYFCYTKRHILVKRPEGKRPLGKPGHRWDDTVKMDLWLRAEVN